MTKLKLILNLDLFINKYIGGWFFLLKGTDLPHRGNGLPATIYLDGSKFWYVNGKRHRIDGPAIDSLFKSDERDIRYYLDGYYYSYSEYINAVERYK